MRSSTTHMMDFIEVFYSLRDSETPYHAIMWRSGMVIDLTKYERLAPLVTYCTQQQLPVLCTDEQIRKQLRLCGINTQIPRPRRKAGEELAYGTVILQPDEPPGQSSDAALE